MKIICIGRNYVTHALELNNPVPAEPIVFFKPKSALAKRGGPVIYPEFTDDLQYECEIVLQISRNGRFVSEANAHRYYDSWTVGIDFTARDVQRTLKAKGLPWERAKAFDHSAIVGDFVSVDREKIDDTRFSLYKNELLVQEGHTQDMIFSFDQIIHFVSRYFTLQIGDLVFTGTPAGVGAVLPFDRLSATLNGLTLLDFTIS